MGRARGQRKICMADLHELRYLSCQNTLVVLLDIAIMTNVIPTFK